MVTSEEIVDHAAEAATDHIFSHYDASDVVDLDIRVSFEDRELDVDVLFETAASVDTSPEQERQIVDDATVAAAAAVDRLIADEPIEDEE